MATTTSGKSVAAKPSQPAGSKVEQHADVFHLERAKMTTRQVPWKNIVAKPQDYSFRKETDADPFSREALAQLRESIKRHGLHTPLLLKACADEIFEVADGHRRHAAIGQLIAEGVQGFARSMSIPAQVMDIHTGELCMIATALSGNLSRAPLGVQGRLDATLRLHQLGMPKTTIAELLGVSDSTIDRDLVLAGDADMRLHIRKHHITSTNAATLLAAAVKSDRREELMQCFLRWLVKADERLRAEEAVRTERDEPPLSGSKLWLQNRMTRETVTQWRHALESGKPLDESDSGLTWRADFEPKGEHGGRVEIGAISKDLDELSASDVAKILRRSLDLAARMEPVLVAKAAAEQQGRGVEGKRGEPSPGLQKLQELGLGGLVGVPDVDEEDDAEAEEAAADFREAIQGVAVDPEHQLPDEDVEIA